MGSVYAGLPVTLAHGLARAGALTIAVETGSFRGDSAEELARCVDQVSTIELDPILSRRVSQRFAGNGHVRVCSGSSTTVLPAILAEVNQPVLFWLDAHTIAGSSSGGGVSAPCPVMGELAAIAAFAHAGASSILIDDARLFFGPSLSHGAESWPGFSEIFRVLDDLGASRYVTVLDDVIISVPDSLRHVVDGWWLELAKTRGGLEYHNFLYQNLRNSPSTYVAHHLRHVAARALPSETRRRLYRWYRVRGRSTRVVGASGLRRLLRR